MNKLFNLCFGLKLNKGILDRAKRYCRIQLFKWMKI